MKHIKESILDFPKDDLSYAIWQKDENGNYVLRDDATATIQKIVDWAQNTFKIPNMKVNITGSITSNSYSNSSDIDIHFSSDRLKKDKADEFNRIFKRKFEDFAQQNPDVADINGVKTEIYMQSNPFQDLMSVGCYDFLGKRWLVGPEFKQIDFDPYAEYFEKDLKSVDDIIDGVRSIILQMYELSVALLKTKDIKFKTRSGKRLVSTMKKAQKMFNALRKRRAHKSSPKDAKEAIQNRNDKDWQIADSAFKLLDKLGYLKILKVATQSIEKNIQPEQAAQDLIDAITEKISSKSLDDSENMFIGQLLEIDSLDESIGSMIKLSFLASLMSFPTLLPATALDKSLKNAQKQSIQQHQSFNINSSFVKNAINDSAKDNVMIGDMSKANVANAVAQVLWKEAKGEGLDGLNAIASVIMNRTGNDPSYIVNVLRQKHAFTCMTSYAGGWTDKTYKMFVPWREISRNSSNTDIWNDCKRIAEQLVNKKFKSTIGNRNSYLNKKTADKSAVDSWGKSCDLKIGNHYFGYLPEHDPNIVVPGTHMTWNQYNSKNNGKFIVVKSGETLSEIAKANNTNISKLMKLNPNLKNPNKISIGQKLRVA